MTSSRSARSWSKESGCRECKSFNALINTASTSTGPLAVAILSPWSPQVTQHCRLLPLAHVWNHGGSKSCRWSCNSKFWRFLTAKFAFCCWTFQTASETYAEHQGKLHLPWRTRSRLCCFKRQRLVQRICGENESSKSRGLGELRKKGENSFFPKYLLGWNSVVSCMHATARSFFWDVTSASWSG